MGIHDTCGVHNLHGMPGVMAGIVGAITAGLASIDQYGYSLYRQFPARAPLYNTTEFHRLKEEWADLEPGLDRSGLNQSVYQIIALVTSMGVAIIGGLLTGTFHLIFSKIQSEI